MIQDIGPHSFNNAFAARRAPRRGDLALLYKGKKILFHREGTEISFPGVEELGGLSAPGEESREDCGYYVRGGRTFIYLFSVDETAFYSIDGWEGEIPGFGWEDAGALRTATPEVFRFAGITGKQLHRWRMDRRFCGGCGGRMVPSGKERAFLCPECGRTVYPKISPAIIAAVTDGERILLLKYANRPGVRQALLAGFAEFGESIEDTVRREAMEEVGLRVKNLRFYKSQPWSFSDSLLMGFYCDLDGSDEITLNREELAEAKWVRREDMPDRSGDISLTAEMMERFRRGEEQSCFQACHTPVGRPLGKSFLHRHASMAWSRTFDT